VDGDGNGGQAAALVVIMITSSEGSAVSDIATSADRARWWGAAGVTSRNKVYAMSHSTAMRTILSADPLQSSAPFADVEGPDETAETIP